MGTDVTRYGGGGDVVVADRGGDLTLNSQPGPAGRELETQADQPLMSDAQHFTALGKSIGEGLAAVGVRDPALVQKAVAVFEELNAQSAKGSLADTLPKLFAVVGPKLVRAGFSDARALSATLASAFEYWVGMQETEEAAIDLEDRAAARATLEKHWGVNYARTVRAIRDFVNNQLPVSLADAIWDGRDADGGRLANSPAVLDWLARLALGAAAGGPGPDRDVLERERKEIETVMRREPRRYDARMRTRYIEILDLLGGR